MTGAPSGGALGADLQVDLGAGPGAVLGAVSGAVLGAVFGGLAKVRGTRALHPVGICGHGELAITPGPGGGVALLEGPGPHPVGVRASRAIGLPGRPDIEGLALRLEGSGGGELLLASTGTGVLTRHLLVLRRPGRPGPLTTLLPLTTAAGGLLVRLDPEPGAGGHPGERGAGGHPGEQHPAEDGHASLPTAYRVLIGAPGRPWHERGRLRVDWTDHDCPRRHDPVAHPPAGTWFSPFWAAVRRPAYRASEEVPARLRPAVPGGGRHRVRSG